MKVTKERLSQELESTARKAGVDLFGIADVTLAHNYVLRTGGEFVASFPRALSLGALGSQSVIEQIKRRAKGQETAQERLVAFYTYRVVSREYLGSLLNQASIEIMRLLEEAGYRAYPAFGSRIPALGLKAPFSHKIAACLSGLGWMGRNCMAITPEYGPRVLLATVLTDAPLETGKPLEDGCGTCRACVEICPANAFTGIPFDAGEPPEMRMNNEACRIYCEDVLRGLGVDRDLIAAGHVCGLCRYVCPFGFKKAREASTKVDLS